jgi:hydroxyacylglutathione hydrolase
MKVTVIPCLKDNYAYLIEMPGNKMSSKNILIDAPDFVTIDQFLNKSLTKLDYIFNTHHHWDHTEGNLELKKKYGCVIVGASNDSQRIPGIDKKLSDDEIIQINNTKIKAISVPGHTSHHLIYHFQGEALLFSGDTLFSMGCGRLFEGSYLEMFESLQKIKSLADETKIYCGHEYSEKNARFALSVDPQNEAIKARYQEVLALRLKNLPTVPTTLQLEKQINPFLRASSVDEFAKLRQLRDSY